MAGPESTRVKLLNAESKKAREAIASTFVDGKVRPRGHANLCAWGQYLASVELSAGSDFGSQFGIFGTAAGVQVLCMHNINNPLIAQAVCLLPLSAGGQSSNAISEIQNHFASKGDLRLVYKLCALLDVSIALGRSPNFPTGSAGPDLNQVVEALLELRAGAEGWPDCKQDDDYLRPNIHATAVALLSLSSAPSTAPVQTACSEALAWLAKKRLDFQSVTTIAMLVMAISQMRSSAGVRVAGYESDEVNQLLLSCEAALLTWISNTAPGEIRRSLEGTEYLVPLPAEGTGSRFTFLFYLPHCLAALAVLSSNRLMSIGLARRFMLSTLDIVTSNVRDEKRYFVAAGRNLVATVEHLWLYRLLTVFEGSSVYSSKKNIIYDWIASARFGRVRSFLLVALLIGLAVWTVFASGALGVVLTAVFGVVSALVGAVAVDFVRRQT